MGWPWTSSEPRLLEAACTALPNLYGGQRRGQPNLAKAIGVDNQNESAGGFAGLATLIWLAPIGWMIGRRGGARPMRFATVSGCWRAYELPPVDNLLRAVPVLDVTDHRRMIALGRLRPGRPRGDRPRPAAPLAALAAAGAAGSPAGRLGRPPCRRRGGGAGNRADAPRAGPRPLRRALRAWPTSDAAILADRQVADTLEYVPRYLLGLTMLLATLAALAMTLPSGWVERGDDPSAEDSGLRVPATVGDRRDCPTPRSPIIRERPSSRSSWSTCSRRSTGRTRRSTRRTTGRRAR